MLRQIMQMHRLFQLICLMINWFLSQSNAFIHGPWTPNKSLQRRWKVWKSNEKAPPLPPSVSTGPNLCHAFPNPKRKKCVNWTFHIWQLTCSKISNERKNTICKLLIYVKTAFTHVQFEDFMISWHLNTKAFKIFAWWALKNAIYCQVLYWSQKSSLS